MMSMSMNRDSFTTITPNTRITVGWICCRLNCRRRRGGSFLVQQLVSLFIDWMTIIAGKHHFGPSSCVHLIITHICHTGCNRMDNYFQTYICQTKTHTSSHIINLKCDGACLGVGNISSSAFRVRYSHLYNYSVCTLPSLWLETILIT